MNHAPTPPVGAGSPRPPSQSRLPSLHLPLLQKQETSPATHNLMPRQPSICPAHLRHERNPLDTVEQQFFRDLERKLWTSANKLLPSLDAAVYKHVILGLVFLKYVSDALEERRRELRAQFQDPASDYFLDPADFGDGYAQALA